MRTEAVLNIIAAILAVIATIIGVKAKLPSWFFVGVLVVIIIAVLIPMAYPLIQKAVGSSRARRKYNRLTRKYFSEFQEENFVDRFDELLNLDQASNIPNTVNKLQFIGENIGIVNWIIGIILQGVFSHFRKRVGYFNNTTEDFLALIDEFDNMVRLYNHSVCKLIERISVENKRTISQQTRENYNKAKIHYSSFIEDYIKFGKKINKVFGQKICAMYFDLPGDL